MRPFMVAAIRARGIGLRLRRIALEPAADVVVITLLAPQQAGKCLPLHAARIFTLLGSNPLRRKIRPLLFCAVRISASKDGPKSFRAAVRSRR